jgi:DNA repair exonuclease SbcCD nuclease subunit
VALHGRSFPRRAVPEDMSASYPPAVPGMLNIGVLHTSAEDPGEHETYAPCSVQSLVAKGYDYWALGHIHQRRVLHEHPFVVFPGNLQGRHPNEPGAKGATLVEARDGRFTIQHRSLDVLRWARVEIDATGVDSLAEIATRARAELGAALPGAEGRPLLCRVTLRGATAQHAALLAEPETMDAEIRNAALAVSDTLHVERVRLETRSPARRDAAGDDAATQLRAAFLDGLDDPTLVERLLGEFRDLAGKTPRLPGRAAPELPQTLAELQALAADAWQMVERALGDGA